MGPPFRLSVLSGVRPITPLLPSWHGANHFVPYAADAITSFSDTSPSQRRHAGDRNALWCAMLLAQIIDNLIVFAGYLLFLSLLRLAWASEIICTPILPRLSLASYVRSACVQFYDKTVRLFLISVMP